MTIQEAVQLLNDRGITTGAQFEQLMRTAAVLEQNRIIIKQNGALGRKPQP